MNCQDFLHRNEDPANRTRRWFFEQCGIGVGAMALANLLADAGLASSPSADPLAPKQPPLPAKAKHVIFLFMAGAPSHLELFDYKPQLAKFDGTLPPADLLKGYRAAFINPNSTLLGPKFKFAKYGQSGAEISELLPHFTEIVDDVAIVKSMTTDAFNHAPGQLLMNTGTHAVRPPQHGLLGHLRPGQRVAEPARLRRLQFRQEGTQRRQLLLGQRLSSHRLPGRAVPRQRRSGALSVEPAGHRRQRAARFARFHPAL